MFDAQMQPRVFAMEPGVDFPRALVDGLRARLDGQPPDAMARVELIVNTARMRRRIETVFVEGPAGFLPRIRLVTDLPALDPRHPVPPPADPLRRRIELTTLVDQLLANAPDLAPRASLFDLADSLAALFDEMQGEGVSADAIRGLDVSDTSGHWDRAKTFLSIVQDYLDRAETEPDAAAQQRQAAERLAHSWQGDPPDHPVILAGSTGSRGTTHLLMGAVSRLPQGAVILPGFDFHMPRAVWNALERDGSGLSAEDHPQFRFYRLMQDLGLNSDDISRWSDHTAPHPATNRLISLALRPAPVTDAWLQDGPKLGPELEAATGHLTLVEAPSARAEALAIALRLRQAAEDGQTAALITPDRMLTRQVTAALDRWGILPDDSAGTPLQLTAPGRFLRHVASLFLQDLTSELLLTVLKHPLCHSGADRGPHLLLTRELELWLRKKGVPYPDKAALWAWAKALKRPEAETWIEWVIDCFCGQRQGGVQPLGTLLGMHVALSERLAHGPEGTGSGTLWDERAGIETRAAVDRLLATADAGGDLSAADYADLFGAVLSRGELRDRDAPHPRILIWGTLEARVQGADLMILGGLNEGSWPEAPAPDPWLNRKLRDRAGLLLPERRIGLSAQDFQQAIGATEVWLTRSKRSDDAETVPSRWINRLINLLSGLPDEGGPEMLDAMRARGAEWLGFASVLDASPPVCRAPRPSPQPPETARPKRLSVTEIKTLIRDPYAIYARRVLRLLPLDPLMRAPDALMRGIVVHDVLEAFIRSGDLRPETLLRMARDRLDAKVPWHLARETWAAGLRRVADRFVAEEHERQSRARPTAFERKGHLILPEFDFCLTAKADRIDLSDTGEILLYDYKTGSPPTKKEQKAFDKQLLLEAMIAEHGQFENVDPAPVAEAVFIGLGSGGKLVPAPLDEVPTAQVLAEFTKLIGAYRDRDRGYTARRAMQKDRFGSDYDHLARFGEWDTTDDPVGTEVGS